MEFVLRHETMEDLVSALAERRVERLAYAGLGELAESVLERPGLELFASEDDLLRGVRIVEDRNLIVHNRGIVNKTYKRKVASSPRAIGEGLGLKYEDVLKDINFLKNSVLKTDRIAVAKWSIPEVPVAISGVLEVQFDPQRVIRARGPSAGGVRLSLDRLGTTVPGLADGLAALPTPSEAQEEYPGSNFVSGFASDGTRAMPACRLCG